MTFEDHMEQIASKALSSLPAAQTPDIYAISFFIYDEDDDPQRPTLTIGYNTQSQVQQVLDNATGQYPDPTEARWNFAYWIQNELAVVGDSVRDPDGAVQRTEWIKELGLQYDEPEDSTHTPEICDQHEQITARFVEACVRLASSLHTSGLIERTLGHRVPVLVHELEYYEQIAHQAEAANPPGLADDFAAWVRDQ
jgi:hypothetical protein